MSVKGHRSIHKTPSENRGFSVPKKKSDAYVAIWTLKKLGWSDRRIAGLKLPSSHHTVSNYFSEACELIDSKELPVFASNEKKLRDRYCGDTSSVEYIDGIINHSDCGGGKRAKKAHYDNNWESKEG